MSNTSGSFILFFRKSFPLYQPAVCRFTPFARLLSSSSSSSSSSKIDQSTYHRLSDEYLEYLSDQFGYIEENLIKDKNLLKNYDCELNYGVLTLKLGEHGTFVINKQPPNKQIWLSSPLSGPKRFDYDNQSRTWLYKKGGKTLGGIMKEELEKILQIQQLDIS